MDAHRSQDVMDFHAAAGTVLLTEYFSALGVLEEQAAAIAFNFDIFANFMDTTAEPGMRSLILSDFTRVIEACKRADRAVGRSKLTKQGRDVLTRIGVGINFRPVVAARLKEHRRNP